MRMIDAIDRSELRGTIQSWRDAHADVDDADGVDILDDVLLLIDAQSTLTPPNEWVSAKDNPPQLTGKYICCIEDTHGHMWSIPADYLLEMKMWVGEFGEIKNKVVYWMPLPAPHDRRPPERQEDT